MFSRIDELEERVKRLEAAVTRLLEARGPLDTAEAASLIEALKAPIAPQD